jgi:CBS domain-containing protein
VTRGDGATNPNPAAFDRRNENRSNSEVREMKVREAMHQGVEWVEPGTTVEALAQRMREHDIGAIPIGENDRLVGMVTDRDIVVRGLSKDADCSSLTARDVMTKGVVFCRDAEEVDDAVRIMEQKEIRRLPVLDENKRMVGMLSLGDVSHATSHEVAGEVTAAVSDHHA